MNQEGEIKKHPAEEDREEIYPASTPEDFSDGGVVSREELITPESDYYKRQRQFAEKHGDTKLREQIDELESQRAQRGLEDESEEQKFFMEKLEIARREMKEKAKEYAEKRLQELIPSCVSLDLLAEHGKKLEADFMAVKSEIEAERPHRKTTKLDREKRLKEIEKKIQYAKYLIAYGGESRNKDSWSGQNRRNEQHSYFSEQMDKRHDVEMFLGEASSYLIEALMISFEGRVNAIRDSKLSVANKIEILNNLADTLVSKDGENLTVEVRALIEFALTGQKTKLVDRWSSNDIPSHGGSGIFDRDEYERSFIRKRAGGQEVEQGAGLLINPDNIFRLVNKIRGELYEKYPSGIIPPLDQLDNYMRNPRGKGSTYRYEWSSEQKKYVKMGNY